MGYLDSRTVTVDAILTKHGRKLLMHSGSILFYEGQLSFGGDIPTFRIIQYPLS